MIFIFEQDFCFIFINFTLSLFEWYLEELFNSKGLILLWDNINWIIFLITLVLGGMDLARWLFSSEDDDDENKKKKELNKNQKKRIKSIINIT